MTSSRRPPALVAVLVLVLAACGGGDGAGGAGGATTTTGAVTTNPGATTTVPDERRAAVSVYLLRGQELIVGEGREPTTEGVAGEALRALLEGPSRFEADAGITSAIPAGTRLLGVTIDGAVARVDLSPEFESGGGSLSMQARVAQVVFTATQFASVDAVRFAIDGEDVDALGGEGLLVEEPLTRGDFEFGGSFGDAGVLPPVLLEQPRMREPVTSPARLSGSANVFEATFAVEVLDARGLVVAEETVTATSGSGTRGNFDATIAFETPNRGLGAIVTFVASARDGSRQDVREIPVQIP
ncbi:MAG: GerMN domain-containing protein [Acidimicrobiia bacterium]